MMLLTTADVVGRYVFNRPFAATVEVTELLLVIVVFFGTGYCAVKGRHVVIELFVTRLSRKNRAITDSIAGLVGLILFSLISWRSVLQAQQAQRVGDMSGVAHIPLFPFYYVVALGCALLALVLLAQLINILIQAVAK